jgi:hypothetical protein
VDDVGVDADDRSSIGEVRRVTIRSKTMRQPGETPSRRPASQASRAVK